MDVIAGASPRLLARVAGALYLVNIIAGAFGIGVVPGLVIVPGDAAATAHNLQAHELLYRLGLVAHLVTTVTNVPLAVIFYDLFKVVSRRLALLVVFFTLVGTAIEAAGLVSQFAPLVLLGGEPYTGALPAAHLQALAYLPGDLSAAGYSVTEVFFGFYAVCIAWLVLDSTFLPRPIGLLMALDGLAYLTYSFANLLAPGLAAHLIPWILLPSLLGEGSLCLWLLVVGVDVERWQGRARAALRMTEALT
jgi:membrane-associated PAP2 superfamily phosphatase